MTIDPQRECTMNDWKTDCNHVYKLSETPTHIREKKEIFCRLTLVSHASVTMHLRHFVFKSKGIFIVSTHTFVSVCDALMSSNMNCTYFLFSIMQASRTTIDIVKFEKALVSTFE